MGFQRRAGRALEEVGQLQRRGVGMALDHVEIEVERSAHPRHHGFVELVELRGEPREANVVRFVQRDESRQIPRLVETLQSFAGQSNHGGILQVSGAMKSPVEAGGPGIRGARCVSTDRRP